MTTKFVIKNATAPWHISAEDVICRHVVYGDMEYRYKYKYIGSRGIEEQIAVISDVVGAMAQFLMDKNIMSSDEFLSLISPYNLSNIRIEAKEVPDDD